MAPTAPSLSSPTRRRAAVTPDVQHDLEQSLARVINWVRAHDYKAYEPADGNSSLLFPLTGGRVLPMRVLQQVVLRCPFNVRPLLGVRPHESAIARGYMAWAYLIRTRKGDHEDLRREAQACLAWLMMNRAAGYDEFCWGDPYEYATRNGRRPYGEPLLIWSALIGQAFLEAFEQFLDDGYLRVAESVGRWIQQIPNEHTASGVCLSYHGFRRTWIHNANVMGAAFLARLGSMTSDSKALSTAHSAMTYTCTRQRSDGSWFYAEDPDYHWIDNFHTGYNLSALKVYRTATGDRSFDDHLHRGVRYFRANFFEADGRPKYFHDRTYPVDIQCAAQAIETLASLAEHDVDHLRQALLVATWTIGHLQAPDGHFCHRDLGWTRVTTPMLHWGQATMAKALAVLLDTCAGDHV